MRRLALALLVGAVACAPVEFGGDLDPDDLPLVGKSDGDPCAGVGDGDGVLSGEALLTWVNRTPEQRLRRDAIPTDLQRIDTTRMIPERFGKLRAAVMAPLTQLLDAAKLAGLELRVRSAYRSFEDQCATYTYWVETKGAEHASRHSALPGHSQHQLGTTVDLTSEALGWQLEPSMATSVEAGWLAAEAWRFGFALSYPKDLESLTGYAYEWWHYRYIGEEAAAEMIMHQLPLETYLERCAQVSSQLTCGASGTPE